MRKIAYLCALVAFTALVAAQSRDARELAIAAADPAAAARAAQLGPAAALVPVDVVVDDLGQAHVRYQQTFRRVPVFEGEAIVHIDLASSSVIGVTDALRAFGAIDIRPGVGAEAARGQARGHLDVPAGLVETADLVVVVDHDVAALVWQVRVTGEDARGPVDRVAFVEAHGRGVLRAWDGLETAQVNGSGVGFFNGAVPLTTNSLTGSFELRDPSRGGQHTIDMRNRQNGGRTFLDRDNLWGNGTLDNVQTVGVDAQYGTAMTWDYYFARFGRRGIANDGRGAYNRVHYGQRYSNAFWSDSCFCMTYGDGDGSTFNPFDSLDVAGHEMSHGVTSRTANLTYSGESGDLNEATSDIFGTMVEFFANNPNDPPDYVIGEKLYRTAGGSLRSMVRPSVDGVSADCWYPGVGSLNVHYGSGVANHFFYLLAEGTAAGAPSRTCVAGNSRIATGSGSVAGIGRSAAERIWYRALTAYMTAGTNYAGARAATLSAATDLFGAGSGEADAVAAAWTAVGVN